MTATAMATNNDDDKTTTSMTTVVGRGEGTTAVISQPPTTNEDYQHHRQSTYVHCSAYIPSGSPAGCLRLSSRRTNPRSKDTTIPVLSPSTSYSGTTSPRRADI